ncbi:PREDICTED: protein YLS9 [Tarenaya hassleriana]|uniref:protein YLS9 n=1 Tax=Tarenaya hassleriana TaxID=28532 RepID=UPI00053C9DD1|nr:PREDICTED: protein YLS9 [Tarenaya hassleriana]
MPSPREAEEQPKTETGHASSEPETRQPPAPPPQPQPENHHPSQPPVMGYPNYPNGPYNTHYVPYGQAPPASYYGSPPSPSPYMTYQYQANRSSAASAGFVRGILTGLIILVVILCLSTVVTWLALRPQLPIFSVTHFTVSGFNASQPDFTAQWTANLTVENPNTKLGAYFNRIQGLVYHQNSVGEDEFLAMGFFTPLHLETKKTVEIGERFTAGEKEEPEVPPWVAEEMMKEREGSGTVSFSLRIAVWVTFKTEAWGERERGLKVICDKLKAGFDGGSGNGAVLLPKPLPCFIYL